MWYWISANSSSLLFIVGAAGVVVACFTLAFIGVQAKAAKNAAETSLLQAKHTVTSERAWLVIRSSMKGYNLSVSDGQLRYCWSIKNTGKTPARIIETQCRFEMVQAESVFCLPDSPNYPPPIKLNGFLLPPGDSAKYFAYLTDESGKIVTPPLNKETVSSIQTQDRYLRVYGYVKYADVFDNERESRFCDYYVPSQNQPEFSGFCPLIDSPAEYTKHT